MNVSFGSKSVRLGIQLTSVKALRLYPSVPGNARFANKATTIPVGGGPDGKSPVFIPKGGTVVYSTFSMHRRKDLYGEDAEEYKPERWETLRVGWGDRKTHV